MGTFVPVSSATSRMVQPKPWTSTTANRCCSESAARAFPRAGSIQGVFPLLAYKDRRILSLSRAALADPEQVPSGVLHSYDPVPVLPGPCESLCCRLSVPFKAERRKVCPAKSRLDLLHEQLELLI